jgi:hypothetical protein
MKALQDGLKSVRMPCIFGDATQVSEKRWSKNLTRYATCRFDQTADPLVHRNGVRYRSKTDQGRELDALSTSVPFRAPDLEVVGMWAGNLHQVTRLAYEPSSRSYSEA